MARKREFDKDKVLEKAMLLFWQNGYEATSIRALKDAMGISSSSMYETFGDKDSIFLAALDRFCDLERKQLSELAEDTSSAIELIEHMFDAVETIAQNTGENQGSLAFNTMVEFGTRNEDITAVIYEHYVSVAEIIAGALQTSQTAGMLNTQHDSLALAHLILSTLYGVATVKGAKPNYKYSKQIKQIILSFLKI